MKHIKTYPTWVYVAREDLTRANMAEYDRQQAALDKRCLEINPDYYKLPMLDRFNIRRQADDDLHQRPRRDPLRPRS